MIKKPSIFWMALCLIIATTAVPCMGAEGKNAPALTVRGSGEFVTSADVGDGDGSVSMTTEELRLGWRMLSLSYSQTQFQWDNEGALSFGNGSDDPWERLHRIALGANYRGKINDDWFYHSGLTLTSSFEKEMAGSYGGALRGGVGYKLNSEVTLMAGLAVMHNSLDTKVMPSLAVSYDGLDESGAGWSGRIGLPASELSYHLDTVSAFRFSFQGTGRTARLADDSVVAERGYVSMSGWKTGLYYDWNPTKAFRLSVGPEYTFGRSIKTYNHSGDELTDDDIDAAWGGMLRMRYAF